MNYDYHLPMKPSISIHQRQGDSYKTILTIETFSDDSVTLRFIDVQELINFNDRLNLMVTAIEKESEESKCQ